MVGQNNTALMNEVTKGPTSIAVDALTWQHYTSGIITAAKCGTKLDHGVVASGYDETKWIVRNSWGPTWGNKG